MPLPRGGGRGSVRGQTRGRGQGGVQQSTPRRPKSALPTPAPDDEEATEANMIKLGMGVVGAMTEDDMEIFLDRLSTECPTNDKIVYGVRCQQVNWEAVAFGAYGPEECQAAWCYLKTGTRKYRTMDELVREVKTTLHGTNADKAAYQKKMLEAAPDFPKKPAGIAGGFQMFCAEMYAIQPVDSRPKNFIIYQAECHDLYKTLSKEQQEKFQLKADMAKAAYAKEVKEFSLRHPGLTTRTKPTESGTLKKITKFPVVRKKYTDVPVPPLTSQLLFIQTKLNKLDVPPPREELSDLKAKYKRKWKKMSERKKAKWIDKCINSCQNYVTEMEEYKKKFPNYVPKDFRIRKRISKDELKIWENFKGKPTRPPLMAFDIFFSEFSKNPENESLPMEERKQLARAKWANLDYYKTEMYKVNIRTMNLAYKQALEKYYEEIPSVIKPIILENVPKRYKHGLFTSADKHSRDEDEHNSIDAAAIGHEYSQSEGETQEEDYDYVDLTEEEEKPHVKKSKKRKHKHVVDDEDMDVVEVLPEDLPLNSDNHHSKKKKKRKKNLDHDEEMTEDDGEPQPGYSKNKTFETKQGGKGYDFPLYHLYDDDQEMDEDDRIKIKKERKKVNHTQPETPRNTIREKSLTPGKTFKNRKHNKDK